VASGNFPVVLVRWPSRPRTWWGEGGTVHAMVFHRWRPRGPAVPGRRRPGGSPPRAAIPTPVQRLIKHRTCVIKRLLSDPPPRHYADKHTQTNKHTHKRARADSAGRFTLVYDNNILLSSAVVSAPVSLQAISSSGPDVPKRTSVASGPIDSTAALVHDHCREGKHSTA